MGNGHIVAIGRAVGGNDDHAALGRLDGRAIGGGNITATVELLPVEGTVSIAKGRRHPGIPRQRPQVAAGTGRATATGRFGVGVRIGVVLILLLLLLLRFLLCLFPGSLFLRLLLGRDLSLIGLFRLGNLTGDAGGIILQLVHLLRIDRGLTGNLLNGCLHAGLLFHQIGLLCLQVSLCTLFGSFALLQLSLGIGYRLTGGGQIVHDLVVVIHHFRDGVDLVQQVRKAVGIEENGPIGHVAPLLHAADPLTEFIVVLGLFLFGSGQFLLLLIDLLTILLDGLLRKGDLLPQNIDLLLQQKLLVQRRILRIGQLVQLLLDIRLLFLQAGCLRLQIVNVLLGHSLRCGQCRCHGKEYHHQRHHQCAKPLSPLLRA